MNNRYRISNSTMIVVIAAIHYYRNDDQLAKKFQDRRIISLSHSRRLWDIESDALTSEFLGGKRHTSVESNRNPKERYLRANLQGGALLGSQMESMLCILLFTVAYLLLMAC